MILSNLLLIEVESTPPSGYSLYTCVLTIYYSYNMIYLKVKLVCIFNNIYPECRDTINLVYVSTSELGARCKMTWIQ